jgi:hypothetical protein
MRSTRQLADTHALKKFASRLGFPARWSFPAFGLDEGRQRASCNAPVESRSRSQGRLACSALICAIFTRSYRKHRRSAEHTHERAHNDCPRRQIVLGRLAEA